MNAITDTTGTKIQNYKKYKKYFMQDSDYIKQTEIIVSIVVIT